MGQLTADVASVTDFIQGKEEHEDLPMTAAVAIYAGAACSKENVAGGIRQLTTGATEVFAGFALRTCNNTTAAIVAGPTNGLGALVPPTDGALGSASVRLRTRGQRLLTVAGGAGTAADENALVYGTDSQTFTTSSAGNAVLIGKIVRWVSGTSYVVEFWAASARPPVAP